MTRADALDKLRWLGDEPDSARAHWLADQVLLDRLDDAEIRAAYEAIGRGYE